MSTTTFSKIAIGSSFRFPRKAGEQLAECGVCTKVSARKYTYEITKGALMRCTIGTVRCPVEAELDK